MTDFKGLLPNDEKGRVMNISCAILAGGRSRRMGYDKAALRIGGKTLISLVYDQAKEVFDDIFVISSYHSQIDGIDVPILKDIMPLQSPLIGIASALLYAENPSVLILACDMPFTSSETFRYMISAVNGADIVIPKLRNGFEPLHAIYRKSSLPVFLNCMERGKLKISDVFAFLTVREIGEHPCFYNNGHSVFMNLNSEKDLALFKSKSMSPEVFSYSRGYVRENSMVARGVTPP